MKNTKIMAASLTAVLALAFGTGMLAAEEHTQGEGTKTEMESAKTFAGAMTEIDQHYGAIAKLIESGNLEDVHKEAEPIKQRALVLAKLATAADSGIPKENVKDINLTGKALAATFEKIDEAADAGKMPETKAVYDEMGTLIAKLKTLSKTAKK